MDARLGDEKFGLLKESVGVEMNEYWFRPKRYGYGATPTNWKGWVSTSAFAAVLAVLMMTMVLPVAGGRPEWEVLLGWVSVAGVTAAFCQFAKARTNGEWRWRWGEKNKSW